MLTSIDFLNMVSPNKFQEPITFIFGGPELFIDLGSTVNLTCVIKHLPDPPLSVHWMHNNEVS